MIFASPYARDFTLIGSVSHAFKGDPAIVAMGVREVAYLCEAANRYFREQITPCRCAAHDFRIPAPPFALRLVLGREMADELLLASQRVTPRRLLASGYPFRFPALEPALRHVLQAG